jgi:predicted dehydrogenase
MEDDYMERIRIGLIGAGVMGEIFARIFRELPQAELMAVADIHDGRITQFIKEFEVKGSRNYEEMLEVEAIDAVAISTPEHLHLQPVAAATKKGKHIFLEKPLATTVEDGKQILGLAKAGRGVFMVGHCLRFDPRFVQGFESINRGDLGELLHIRAWRETSIVNGERLQGRTSPVFFVGVHDIDIFHWYTGSRVKRVHAESVRKKLTHLGTDDAVFAVLKFENGVIASLETSWILPKTQSQIRSNTLDKGMEVVGTQGMLSIQADNIGIIVQTEREIFYPDIIFSPMVQGMTVGIYKEELEHFLKCILEEKEPATNGTDALQAVVVARAIETSLQEGKPMEI